MFGEGSQTRSFQYVTDLVEGLDTALAESDEHLPVNIGNPAEFTILELAEDDHRAHRVESDIVFSSLPKDDPVQRNPDITRASDVLGWEPQVTAARWSRDDARPSSRAALVGAGGHSAFH